MVRGVVGRGRAERRAPSGVRVRVCVVLRTPLRAAAVHLGVWGSDRTAPSDPRECVRISLPLPLNRANEIFFRYPVYNIRIYTIYNIIILVTCDSSIALRAAIDWLPNTGQTTATEQHTRRKQARAKGGNW